MEFFNRNQIVIYYLFVIIGLVYGDCGLPAIPFNAQIDKVQQIYYEGESVQYHCQLDDLKLIGNSSRKCVNSKWLGTIPRCVEELGYGTISLIDLADQKNHTLKFDGRWRNTDSSAAYSANYKRDKCLKSSKMSRPHYWKLHLTKVQRHISYMEIVVMDKYKQLDKTDVSKIVKYAKVNELRGCEPELVESVDSSIRISLTCFMEFDGDSKYEAWERDVTQLIAIEFDVDDITICEIRLFTNSFMPFHRCGSADVVLHSTMEFVQSGIKYGRNSYYKYKCDDGFELEGNEDVRCGLNNQWLDPFPTCRPRITCPYPPSKHESITVNVKLEHSFNFDSNMSVIIGSIASYSCVGDHSNNSVMIGDSVRVCGEDGKWSGIDPICIHDFDLNAEYYEELVKNKENDKDLTTFKSFDSIIRNENQTSLACGIPAMPLFAKPTSSQRYRLFGAQSDLRLWYENGSTIYYQCESAYRWVTGDVDSRTCVNGKWVGRVGKCAVNWGNKIRLYSIYVFDDDGQKWVNQHYVMETNDTNLWDEHFAYRQDPDKGNCATFTVDTKHRWVLRLNQSTTITYFVVMLHPGGFFGNKRRINDPKILENSPVTAEVGNRQCVLTSAWDYTYSRIGTFFFFTCDMDEPKYRYTTYESYINLYIDPKKFLSNYKPSNISLCSLAVMVSKEDCGTPDVPLHSIVTYDKNTHEWTYSCNEGYELIGSPTMSCGRNGRWVGEFPTCQRKELCQTHSSFDHIIKYNNLEKINDKYVAVVDSLANYSCFTRSNDNKVMIGSSLRACTTTGQWSGTAPLCIDPSTLPRMSKTDQNSASTTKIFAIVILSLLALVAIFGGLYYAYLHGVIRMPNLKVPNLTIPKINVQSPTTVSATPNIYGSTDEVLGQQPTVRSCKINEDLPAFPKGTEPLVEPDSSEA